MSTPTAVLFEYPTLNGGERSWLATLAGLRARGYAPWAIVPRLPAMADHPLREALQIQAVETIELAWRDDAGVKRPLAAIRADLAALLHDRRPSLLHANSFFAARLAAPVCHTAGAPCVGHLRDIVHRTQQVVDDLNQATRLLAVSQAVRDAQVAGGLAPDLVRVCWNGVDRTEFQPRTRTGALHRELGLPAVTPLLLAIGQIALRKGFNHLLEAAARLFAQPDMQTPHLLIVGERHADKGQTVDFERALRRRAAEFPLAGRVHFLGRRTDVARLMNEATLLVHSARQEPLGRVLLEAAASGLPIVATDVGGTREILLRDPFDRLSELAGRLVPKDDPAALAAAMRTALTEQEEAAHRAALAQNIAAARFDANQAAARVAEQYAAVLAEAAL